ncbi:hypothetical protein AB6N21_003326 [Thiohalocapsa marina]
MLSTLPAQLSPDQRPTEGRRSTEPGRECDPAMRGRTQKRSRLMFALKKTLENER